MPSITAAVRPFHKGLAVAERTHGLSSSACQLWGGDVVNSGSTAFWAGNLTGRGDQPCRIGNAPILPQATILNLTARLITQLGGCMGEETGEEPSAERHRQPKPARIAALSSDPGEPQPKSALEC